VVATTSLGIMAPTPLRRSTILAVALAIVASLLLPVARASLLPKADPALLHEARAHPGSSLPVIVREASPASAEAEETLRRLGGSVTHQLPIIGSFSGRIPARALSDLIESPAVVRVWGDGRLSPSSVQGRYQLASPDMVWRDVIRAGQAYTGAGVTVALLDTGVRPVADLGDRVLARVDFTPDHDGYDRFGHGTHMAGIIAGDGVSSKSKWAGVAPDANLVSVKVAGADGSTDVSVVIAGLQWIVSHRTQYDIRVLNLSFGTDSTQSYLLDPLNYAVEQVWAAGIFVVVAAGNRGDVPGTTNKPADDPFVLTVGAVDTHNTPKRRDDEVAEFSSRGPTQDGVAKPDLVAPGISIVSNRATGSTIDQAYPSARVGRRYFKGTGTSQAAAMVSGVAATVLEADPALTPDLLKAILTATADRKVVDNAGEEAAGAGMVNADAAVSAALGSLGTIIVPANQGLAPSTGLGSLDASRGSYHVYADVDGDGDLELVTGELDVLGRPWTGPGWNGDSWSGNEWSAYVFEGEGWAGDSWSGDSWSGTSWSSDGWNGNEWSGNEWAGDNWS
jgi:serine protease AprX